MKMSSIGLALATAASIAVAASSAGAQQSASPPPAGPALPGVCVLSNERMVLQSAVGKYVISRMEQLNAQAQAELSSEGAAIEADGKALQSQSATLPQDQLQSRGAALNQRYQALQRKAQIRQRELDVTKQKAFSKIDEAVDPIVRTVFVQRGCSLLFNGGAALIYPAPSMDVTDAVIRSLDAKLQQFPFDREHLEQQAGAQSGN